MPVAVTVSVRLAPAVIVADDGWPVIAGAVQLVQVPPGYTDCAALMSHVCSV